MNPHFNSRKSFAAVCGALIAAAFVPQPTANAAAVLSLTDSTGIPTSINILAGDTFILTLNLTASPESIAGITYFLEAPGAGSTFFRLVGRDVTGSQFSDLTTTNTTALASASALLDPTNNSDLGGTTPSGAGVGPSAEILVATLSLQALPTIALGSYTIQLSSNSLTFDSGGNDVATTRQSYTVNVVPEPTSMIFLGVGLVTLAANRRRPFGRRGRLPALTERICGFGRAGI